MHKRVLSWQHFAIANHEEGIKFVNCNQCFLTHNEHIVNPSRESDWNIGQRVSSSQLSKISLLLVCCFPVVFKWLFMMSPTPFLCAPKGANGNERGNIFCAGNRLVYTRESCLPTGNELAHNRKNSQLFRSYFRLLLLLLIYLSPSSFALMVIAKL